MDNFWIDFGISIVITTLRGAIRNEKTKEQVRKAMKKVYTTILQAYPEFKEEENI